LLTGLTGLSPGAIAPVPGDLATEMMQFSYEVYNQNYKYAGGVSSLYSLPEPLAYNAASPPSETGTAVSVDGWEAVSAMQLGMAPADYRQGTLSYSFVNGLYQANAVGATAQADAMVLLGVMGGENTLTVDFRGTDQVSDFGFHGNFDSYYAEFTPLVNSIENYLADTANDIQQVIVSGHSLGAAALQYFIGALESQRQQDPTVQEIEGYTDGSPGSENPAVGLPIDNFVQIGDPVSLVPSVVGSQGEISALSAALRAAGPLGIVAAGFLSQVQPKTRVGSDIVIDDDGSALLPSLTYHDSLLYAQNVETLYQFASDLNSPFAYSQIGMSLADDTLYTPSSTYRNPFAPSAMDGNEIAVSAIVSSSDPVPSTNVYIHSTDNYVLGGNLVHIFWDVPIDTTVHVVDGGPSSNAIVTLLGPSTAYVLETTNTVIGPDVQVYALLNGVPQLIGDVYRVPLSNFVFTGGYVASVTTSETGDVATGQSVQLSLTMSGPVSVDTSGGSPSLTLGDPVIATYDAGASNPAAGTLVFDYTPAAGDQFADLHIEGVNLNGAVVDGVGDAAVDFSGAIGDTGLSVNSPLTVVSVASSQTGHVTSGQTIQLSLTMSEAFTINIPDYATVALSLNDNGIATYDAGSSNPSAGLIVFDYTVGSTDETANLAISNVNLTLGATVEDANGYNADFSGALNVGTGVQVGAPVVAPVIMAPTAAMVGVGHARAITGVGIAESPTISGENFTAVLTDSNGVLAASAAAGATVTPSNGGKTLTIGGTLSQVNAALATLSDTDATAGSDTITISDSIGAHATPATIEVTVDPGPIANNGSVTEGHGKTVNLTALINGLVAPGIDGDTETLTSVTAVLGTAVLGANNAVTYTAPGRRTRRDQLHRRRPVWRHGNRQGRGHRRSRADRTQRFGNRGARQDREPDGADQRPGRSRDRRRHRDADECQRGSRHCRARRQQHRQLHGSGDRTRHDHLYRRRPVWRQRNRQGRGYRRRRTHGRERASLYRAGPEP